MSYPVKQLTDSAFRKYGRVFEKDYALNETMEVMKKTAIPEDVIYVASVPELESLEVFNTLQDSFFGGLPIQIGYCNGHNQKLNALEYHRSSELNLAVTDMILLIGSQQDITDDFQYDTSKVEAFYVPAGTLVEMYATTLHYAPCGVDGAGFQCMVVLPKDTNLDLVTVPSGAKEDRLLTARNKWLIAHEEAGIEGAFVGLVGENITV